MKISNSNKFKIVIFIGLCVFSMVNIAEEAECSEKSFLSKKFPCATGEGYIQEGCKNCSVRGSIFSCNCKGQVLDIDINSKGCKETDIQKVDLTYYEGALVCLRSPK